MDFFSEVMTPLMLFTVKFIIEYLEDDSASLEEGLLLLALFCSFAFIFTFLRYVSSFFTLTFMLVLRKSTIGLLYRKMLRLSLKSVARTSAAKIINLASADISSLERNF